MPNDAAKDVSPAMPVAEQKVCFDEPIGVSADVEPDPSVQVIDDFSSLPSEAIDGSTPVAPKRTSSIALKVAGAATLGIAAAAAYLVFIA